MILRLVLFLVLLGPLAPGRAAAHAHEPGFLELQHPGGAEWRVAWRKPQAAGRPMATDAVLPVRCDPRRGSPPAFTVPEDPGAFGVFASCFPLGVDRTLKGIDHLLFVLMLLLLIRDWRRLLGAVTAFTVAHSLSLAAASLGLIVVPAPPVEAIVALSIAFLAAELLHPPDRRSA